VSLHDHLLVAELLGDIIGRRARNLNPGLGEKSAGREDESQVKDGVERIVENLSNRLRGRYVVSKTANRDRLGASTSFDVLPSAEKTNKEVRAVTLVQKLGEEVKVGHEGGLEDDRDVRCVEQLDWVRALLATVLLVLDREINTEALEVDDNNEDEDGSEQVRDVGEILAVESFLERTDFVGTGDEEMEKGNDRAFELGTTASVDGSGGEGFPNNVLTDVCGDEEGDTRAKAVSLLEKLVEDDDNHTGKEKLDDDEDRVARAKFADITVHAGDNVGDGLADGDKDAEKLLGTTEKSAVFLQALVNFDYLRASKELHHEA